VNRKIRYRHQSKARKPVNGFSMVEVLIAGILLASALAAVSRISVAALSGSARLSDRARIEAAINDNIQTMQKEDSYFTDAWIIKNGLQSACLNPTEALSNHLKSVAPEPRLAAITRSFDISSVPGILQIVYSFEGPERQITVEKRIIEMTPNFASKCYSMQ
jgi:type II secretory pathway pseudopilin PulG